MFLCIFFIIEFHKSTRTVVRIRIKNAVKPHLVAFVFRHRTKTKEDKTL